MPEVHDQKESLAYICNNIFSVYPVSRYFRGGELGAFSLLTGLIYIVTSLLILFWIKRQARIAQYGDHLAVQSVIFPVFVKVLYFNAFASLYVGVVLITLDAPTDADQTFGSKVAYRYVLCCGGILCFVL